ncbi:restriction endonuclease subunit S [Streptomyces adonidis]|uniref:restriction endonuclease subunit S n=1 Tax=Streptomyces adonidis TaxID=3231367 RepID=UPI0034DB6573
MRSEWNRLDTVADVAGGVALGRTVPDAARLELPYLRVANVQDGFIDTTDVKRVSIHISEIDRFRLRRGDVLLTEGGDFDKLGRGAVWDGRVDPCLYQNHIFRVRCHLGRLIPEFLSLYLSSTEGRRYFLGIAKQTTNLATISSSQLKAMPVPCPDLSVQRRVVEVLEAVREEERAIEASISKQDLLQEGLLRELLAPQEHWKALNIRDLGEVVTGMTPPSSWDAEGAQASIPLITPTQIVGRSEVAGSSRLISRAHQMRLRGVPALSTLSVCIGFGLGKVAFSTVDCCTNQQINSVIPHAGMDPRFVYLVVSEAMRHARSRAGLQVTPILNKSDFSHLSVRVPDIEEQRRIAEHFWAASEAQLKLGDELTKLRTLKQGLADDLLGDRVRVGDVA